jgi:pteridine reductase
MICQRDNPANLPAFSPKGTLRVTADRLSNSHGSSDYDRSDLNSNPTVWVTGSGAKRVGRTVAEHFARQGYRVALHANTSREGAMETLKHFEGQGIQCMVTQGDIRSQESIEQGVAQIVDQFGRLDAVVHCAAVWDWSPLEQTTEDQLRAQFEINTLGAYHVARSAGLAMVPQPQGGRIILIGDWAVARPYANFSAYFLGKGAIETLVRSMAVELATRNPDIHVNGIMPGPVMLDPSITPERAEKILHASLIKRHGRPEDIAQAAYFLATQSFITGICLPVDGGRTIWAPDEAESVAHPTYQVDKDK